MGAPHEHGELIQVLSDPNHLCGRLSAQAHLGPGLRTRWRSIGDACTQRCYVRSACKEPILLSRGVVSRPIFGYCVP